MAISTRGRSLSVTGTTAIALVVNGEERRARIEPSDTLLHMLREGLGLTGAKPGCENGDCGACTVLVDGGPVKSCLMLAAEATGHEITTVEGLRESPVPNAFLDHWAFQCGYCTSGFLMAMEGLLAANPDAGEVEMTEWLRSNVCRCTGYEEIRLAARSLLGKTKALPNFP